MLNKTSVFFTCCLVFVAFTNLSTFTINRFGISLLPVLLMLIIITLCLNAFSSNSFRLFNYQVSQSYVPGFFFLSSCQSAWLMPIWTDVPMTFMP